jgi:hypothetical protein
MTWKCTPHWNLAWARFDAAGCHHPPKPVKNQWKINDFWKTYQKPMENQWFCDDGICPGSNLSHVRRRRLPPPSKTYQKPMKNQRFLKKLPKTNGKSMVFRRSNLPLPGIEPGTARSWGAGSTGWAGGAWQYGRGARTEPGQPDGTKWDRIAKSFKNNSFLIDFGALFERAKMQGIPKTIKNQWKINIFEKSLGSSL